MSFKSAGFLAAAGLAVIGMTVGPAGAATSINGSGKVRCTVIGTVKYKPPLKATSSGPSTTTLKTTLSCGNGGSTGDGLHLASGKNLTKTSNATNDCASVLTPSGPPQPGTGSVKWKQTTGTAKQNPSSITLTRTGSTQTPQVTVDSSGPVNSGSYHGETATSHTVIQETSAQIIAACGGKGLKVLHITTGSTLNLD